MKKTLFGIAALATSFLFNQPEANAQKISVGPRLGLNISNVAFSDGDSKHINEMEEDKTSLTGVHAGLVANIGVNEIFSIQPEILFSQKGLKYEDDGDSFATQMNYLEIPVLGKFMFGSDDINFFINAGPYAAYMMGGKHMAEFGGDDLSTEIDFDYPDQHPLFPNNNREKPNRMDFGLAVGAGLGINAGPGTFNLEARYGFGFNDITEYEKERPNGIPKATHRNLGISVGYLFSLGK